MDWDAMDENMKLMETRDAEAKARGEIVGRYINHPFADGYAYYEIVKENKQTVRIQVITDIGDDWVLPAWGKTTSIKKNDALHFLALRDAMAELFS